MGRFSLSRQTPILPPDMFRFLLLLLKMMRFSDLSIRLGFTQCFSILNNRSKAIR